MNRQSITSEDKVFALSVKPMTPSEHLGIPHMEWNGTDFAPKRPAPSPRIDIQVSIMHAAHERFGVKWKGSRKGIHKPHTVRTLADSGCQTCTAGIDILEEIGCPLPYLVPTSHRIMGITKSSLDIIGSVFLRIEYGGEITRQMVHISTTTKGLYLSETALKDLGLLHNDFPQPLPCTAASSSDDCDIECEGCGDGPCVQRTSAPDPPKTIPFAATKENIPKFEKWFLQEFGSSAFLNCSRQLLPAMTGAPMKITLKNNEQHKNTAVFRPIPVPFHYKKPVKGDLDRDERVGVCRKVGQGETCEHCAQMVITPKANGKPRRTVDYQALNKVTEREVHHTPSPINLVASIPPGMLKTVVDAWNGYHSLPLDPESVPLTTFITEWGRYQYLRGPQGYHGTGDAFTRRFDDITADEERYVRCIDDGLLYDSDIEEAFWHTFNHLKLCADNGVTLNKEKFKFGRETVEFAGFDVTTEGYKPSQRIINAIRDFPTPTSTTDVRSWFGLVNQVAYTFSQSQVMHPFRCLLQGKKPFYWDSTLDELFRNSKEEIVRLIGEGVKAYDMDKPTCLATDWSKEGLGFSLMQKHCNCQGEPNPNCGNGHWKLVYAGSKTTNSAESRYCPIEGECLAAAYGLVRCRMYTLGCPNLTLAVDHNPLTRILNDRNLDDVSNPRLRRLKEKTLPFRFNITHVPGGSNAMKMADALSRHPAANEERDVEFEELDKIAHAFATSQAEGVESISWQRVKEAASLDKECVALVEAIIDGFPKRDQLPLILQKYWGMREELYVVEGVPFKGKKMLIPLALRQQVLEGLHAANQGVTGMLTNARERFFWPGLDAAVRQMRLQCRQCNEQSPSQHAEPIMVSPPPEVPFEQTASDIFSLEGHTFVAFADEYSGWLEVERLSTNSFRNVRKTFLRWFTTYGVPSEIATDGGPPFNSHDYNDFCHTWNIRRRLSSAYYPQSNGRAEAAVKSAKRILLGNINAVTGNLDTDAAARAIMTHRNTPSQDTGVAPSVVLFGRPIRDHLPHFNREIRSEWGAINDAREKALAKRALKAVEPNLRELPPLNVGDSVQVQNQSGNHPTKWHNTGVISQCLPHRQYHVVVDGSRRITLRNRKFLRKISPLTRNARDLDDNVPPPPSASHGDPLDRTAPVAQLNLTPTVITARPEVDRVPTQQPSPDNLFTPKPLAAPRTLDLRDVTPLSSPPKTTDHQREKMHHDSNEQQPCPSDYVRWSSRERVPRKLFTAKLSGKSHV